MKNRFKSSCKTKKPPDLHENYCAIERAGLIKNDPLDNVSIDVHEYYSADNADMQGAEETRTRQQA